MTTTITVLASEVQAGDILIAGDRVFEIDHVESIDDYTALFLPNGDALDFDNDRPCVIRREATK